MVLLARNHELLTPLTHHFLALAALGLLELAGTASSSDGGGTGSESLRQEVTELAATVIEFSVAPSMWNDAVREVLSGKMPALVGTVGNERPQGQEQQQQQQQGQQDAANATTTAAAAAAANQQNLLQLADLATAVETTVAAAAAAGDEEAVDGLKQEPEPLVTGGGEGEGVVEGAVVPGAEENHVAQVQVQGETQAQVQGVDVRGMLREGYLTCFGDLIEG